ncbi:hypothetical protein [Methanococcoides burtonii]|nr:hypothetical protein [Methanococcoides burtonii]
MAASKEIDYIAFIPGMATTGPIKEYCKMRRFEKMVITWKI